MADVTHLIASNLPYWDGDLPEFSVYSAEVLTVDGGWPIFAWDYIDFLCPQMTYYHWETTQVPT